MLNTASEYPAWDVPMPRLPQARSIRIRPATLADIRRFIEAHYAERITLEQLADAVGLSIYRFITVFRRETGLPPHRYVCAVRVRAAQELLRAGVPPAIAAIEVGFFDQSHLCRHFRAVCGMTPGQFLAKTDAPGVLA
jgi:AraC-like DNA-binding protein